MVSNGVNKNLVCVFCAAHYSTNDLMNQTSYDLGRELVNAGYGLVYGGGGRGLMGRVAQGAADNNGRVLGIIPKALTAVEGTTEIGETILVNDMHERKQLFNTHAVAFITMPGGFGTLEELLEISTWSQLSIHSKPVIVLNVNGFYDPLKEMIKNAVDVGFVKPESANVILFCNTISEAINAISTYEIPKTRYALDWGKDTNPT